MSTVLHSKRSNAANICCSHVSLKWALEVKASISNELCEDSQGLFIRRPPRGIELRPNKSVLGDDGIALGSSEDTCAIGLDLYAGRNFHDLLLELKEKQMQFSVKSAESTSLERSLITNEKDHQQENIPRLHLFRDDLERVGRAVLATDRAAKYIKMARILIAINHLATNLPACVLEHSRQEIDTKYSDGQIQIHSDQEPWDLSEESSIMEDSEGDESDHQCQDEVKPVQRRRASIGSHSCDTSHSTESVTSEPKRLISVESLSNLEGLASISSRKEGIARIASFASIASSETGDESHGPLLPSFSYFTCAVLFVDISGFTKLSTLLDPESLSKVINAYFDVIVNKIEAFGGDVQKFAGDAIFAEWRVSYSMDLDECALYATACGAALVRDCCNFPVAGFGGLGAEMCNNNSCVSTLNVHCGLGVGRMTGVHVGDKYRREYVYLGEPIDQATDACNQALLGEVVASPQVQKVLAGLSMENDLPIRECSAGVVATHHPVLVEVISLMEMKFQRKVRSLGLTALLDSFQIDKLEEYQRLLALYTHPLVADSVKTLGSSGRSANDRQRDEAEIRTVFTMFVKPLISLRVSGQPEDDYQLFQTLNSIMMVATRELTHHCGHLRQLIIDDKGLVLIATFGLRGSTFPNMVAERALPAAVALQRALRIELDVDSRIGATLGDVYCGPVGGNKRNEYAVLGPSVNLAARLMCSDENPGLLVDNAVRNLASERFGFRARTPVYAKGYTEPVAIYEPILSADRTWGEPLSTFVGRSRELKTIITAAQQMLSSGNAASRMLVVSARSGMGKSSALIQAVDQVENIFAGDSESVVIAKHAGIENQSQSPFSAIKPLLAQVLKCAEGKLKVDSPPQDIHSFLSSLASKLGAPQLIVDYAMRKLIEPDDDLTRAKALTRDPSTRALCAFVGQVIVNCATMFRLTLIAIDDIHQVDVLSWQVLRTVFERARNVLILGTAGTTSTLHMEEDFWDALNRDYLADGRFVKIELFCLQESEIVEMITKTLHLQEEHVSKELLNEVLVQSGGTPRFASQILEGIKRRRHQDSVERSCGRTDDAVEAIIINRVDSFDVTLRSTLNVGAVLGSTFMLSEIVSVLKMTKDASEGELKQRSIQALRTAVEDGILYAGSYPGEEVDLTDESTSFTFYRPVWRSTLLRLMLESRQRDLHRKIAQSIEFSIENLEAESIEQLVKAFQHWSSAGDSCNATKVALRVGRNAQGDSNHATNSIDLYDKALRLWGWKSTMGGDGDFTSQVLEFLNATDLSDLLSLLIARGRAKAIRGEYRDSVATFKSALRVLDEAKSSPQLPDRSVVFPAFVGLSYAASIGELQQDIYCRYETALLRKFLQETKAHGRLIHHIQALSMQMDLYSRLGEYDKAIAVHSVLKTLYVPERHSKAMRKVYGQDSGALSFTVSAFLHTRQGNDKQALRNARHVMKNLIHYVEMDFVQIFAMTYRLVLVLKEAGQASEALRFLDKMIGKRFKGMQSQGKPYHVLSVARALRALLKLLGEKGNIEETVSEVTKWAEDVNNLSFDGTLNLDLARLGRCGDSISGEICVLLAEKLSSTNDVASKTYWIEQGITLIDRALIFHRKHGLKLAHGSAEVIQKRLRRLRDGNNN